MYVGIFCSFLMKESNDSFVLTFDYSNTKLDLWQLYFVDYITVVNYF